MPHDPENGANPVTKDQLNSTLVHIEESFHSRQHCAPGNLLEMHADIPAGFRKVPAFLTQLINCPPLKKILQTSLLPSSPHHKRIMCYIVYPGTDVEFFCFGKLNVQHAPFSSGTYVLCMQVVAVILTCPLSCPKQ